MSELAVPGPGGLEEEQPCVPAGHRLSPAPGACLVEAWGPDRAACVTEALDGLVEEFCEPPDVPSTQLLPLSSGSGGADDVLVSLLEDVIDALDVFAVVPVRFHLGEVEDGSIAGDMEVVPASRVTVIGPLPRAVCHRDVSLVAAADGWRCRVLVEV